MSMWFSNVKTGHTIHFTHIIVQFKNPVISWRNLYKIVGEWFSNVFMSNITFKKNMSTIVTELILYRCLLVFENISMSVSEPTKFMWLSICFSNNKTIQEVLSRLITVQFQMQLCHGREAITEPKYLLRLSMCKWHEGHCMLPYNKTLSKMLFTQFTLHSQIS